MKNCPLKLFTFISLFSMFGLISSECEIEKINRKEDQEVDRCFVEITTRRFFLEAHSSASDERSAVSSTSFSTAHSSKFSNLSAVSVDRRRFLINFIFEKLRSFEATVTGSVKRYV